MMANSNQSMGMCIRALLLGVLVCCQVACFPLNAPFLEGTEVLEKKERRLSTGGMIGAELSQRDNDKANVIGVLPLIVATNRVGFGIGSKQELRFEGAFPFPPSVPAMIKLSWKWKIRDWVAVTAGTGIHFGLIGLFALQDIGMILSTGVAEDKPGKRVRPYVGVRMTWVPRLVCWEGLCDHSLAPSASLGIQIAATTSALVSAELGYSGRYRIKLPDDPVFMQNSPTYSLPAMMHSVFLAGGVSWRWNPAEERAKDLAKLRGELFSELTSRADLTMAQGDYDGAIGFFERALAVEDQPWILCNIGEAYRRKLEWAPSRVAFQRCIERDPTAQYVDAVRQILRELPEVVP